MWDGDTSDSECQPEAGRASDWATAKERAIRIELEVKKSAECRNISIKTDMLI